MADYQNPPVETPPVDDLSGSTQMFRAFVDEPQPKPATAVSESSRTGVITVGVVVVLAIIAAVVYLAVK